MVCAAWCDVPILQGIGQLSTTQPPVQLAAVQCGSLERFLWLLPLTLSTLIKQEPWTQITGKVNKDECCLSDLETLCRTQYCKFPFLGISVI